MISDDISMSDLTGSFDTTFAVLFLSTVAISPGDGMITSNCPRGAEERRGGEAISSALPRPELELW